MTFPLAALLCNPMDCSLPDSSVHGDSPGKYIGVGCRALLQGIFPTQRSNPALPYCRQILSHLSYQRSPKEFRQRAYSQNRAVTSDTCKAYGLSVVNLAEPRDQSPFCAPLSLQGPSPCELPSSALKSQITIPNILFCLQLTMVFEVRVLAILVSLFHAYMLCKLYSSKASILWHSAFFIVQLSHPYMTSGKTIALTRLASLGKVMSLLFNMLCRLVIAFLPRSKRLLI